MGKTTGFLEHSRELAPRRPVTERVNDWFWPAFNNHRPKLTIARFVLDIIIARFSAEPTPSESSAEPMPSESTAEPTPSESTPGPAPSEPTAPEPTPSPKTPIRLYVVHISHTQLTIVIGAKSFIASYGSFL